MKVGGAISLRPFLLPFLCITVIISLWIARVLDTMHLTLYLDIREEADYLKQSSAISSQTRFKNGRHFQLTHVRM